MRLPPTSDDGPNGSGAAAAAQTVRVHAPEHMSAFERDVMTLQRGEAIPFGDIVGVSLGVQQLVAGKLPDGGTVLHVSVSIPPGLVRAFDAPPSSVLGPDGKPLMVNMSAVGLAFQPMLRLLFNREALTEAAMAHIEPRLLNGIDLPVEVKPDAAVAAAAARSSFMDAILAAKSADDVPSANAATEPEPSDEPSTEN